MAQSVIQPSFAAGEVSPNIYARVDLAKYRIGAARIYNAYVDYRGGVTSRPGTRFVAMAGQVSNTPIRLIKFQFSVLQTYCLEFGHYYMRVIKNGGLVLGGDGQPYVLATPWAAADLALLKFAQSNDVITLTHPSYPIYDLARLAENNWSITRVVFDLNNSPPTGLQTNVFPGSTESQTIYHYTVTGNLQSGVETLASRVVQLAPNNFSSRMQSIEIAVTPEARFVSYNFYKGVPVQYFAPPSVWYPTGSTYGLIGRSIGPRFLDTNILPDYTKTPPSHRDPFAEGAIQSFTLLDAGAGWMPQGSVTIADPTGTGFIGNVLIGTGATLAGVEIISAGRGYTNPTVVLTPNPGAVGGAMSVTAGPLTGLYPGVVTYFQQRKVFAASLRAPATYWATRSGQFNNMDVSLPIKDDDALTFTLAALEQNPIKYMIPVQNGLIMLTGAAAWLISGGSNNTALTPTSVQQTPQVYNGCADVLPLVIGTDILYVQEKGYVVQDLTFSFLSNVYTGEDRTYLASHLFQGRMIVDWTWAEQPQKLVWAVMNDGKMTSMTYIKEQEVFGWAQHEFYGAVKSICTVSEGDEDVVYLAIQRSFGLTIERMASRRVTSMADAWCLDAALKYSGPPATRISGLPQLDGEFVQAVADGVLVKDLIVQGGAISLPIAASNVLVGYGFNSEFQSLYLDVGEPTIQGKRKNISAITTRVINSKGLKAGSSFDKLTPIKESGGPTNLFSRDERIVMDATWQETGQVCLRGTPGCPWTLTALIPEVSVGDSRG